ncbi:thioesterase family protein [Tenacibaculum maritimum]|uniref:acyl-CoA thioesterase n=1 Tax=Tenacibaculum maritimum TaxID=107401 RepID=UPI0023070C41|nr:thioesterase family protein [Tenacibaculum maritimum]MDB0602209.1 thioesterase family protein [Tenacibaculum maritimum]MDB0611419.1 thioesterase family protein [Tenacibaculum maritimum]
MSFSVNFTTRWADFDANIHMRHTAYNDYAAESRLRYFKKFNVTVQDFAKEKIGPILFEENIKFFREIHLGQDITVSIQLTGLSKNGERWKIRHQVFNDAGKLSAEINVYGAWIDTVKRKLTSPSEKFRFLFTQLEKTEDFQEIPIKNEKI